MWQTGARPCICQRPQFNPRWHTASKRSGEKRGALREQTQIVHSMANHCQHWPDSFVWSIRIREANVDNDRRQIKTVPKERVPCWRPMDRLCVIGRKKQTRHAKKHVATVDTERGSIYVLYYEPLAKLSSEADLLAETAEKRRVPVLSGDKIGLPTKPKRTGK